jgi:hypothetical protein
MSIIFCYFNNDIYIYLYFNFLIFFQRNFFLQVNKFICIQIEMIVLQFFWCPIELQ